MTFNNPFEGSQAQIQAPSPPPGVTIPDWGVLNVQSSPGADRDGHKDEDDSEDQIELLEDPNARSSDGRAGPRIPSFVTPPIPKGPTVQYPPRLLLHNADSDDRIEVQPSESEGSDDGVAEPGPRFARHRLRPVPDVESSPWSRSSDARTGFQRDTRPWKLETYSRVIPVTFKKICFKQKQRGSILKAHNVGDILHDLLAASFVPLTDHLTDPEEIQDQAAVFLSSFSGNSALWKVDVGTLPFRQGQLIMGLSANARDEAVGRRFLRFRFPLVRFEWQVETPYSALKFKGKEAVEIKLLWKAWSRSYASSALVAYGITTDTLVVTEEGYPVIKKRLFQVTNLMKPELMTPVPYPSKLPPLTKRDDFLIFSTSQTVIQTLQESKERMAFLVALSALATSLKPIVDRSSHAAGWVLTGIGIIAAATSLLSVVVGWMLKWLDANAARHRQLRERA